MRLETALSTSQSLNAMSQKKIFTRLASQFGTGGNRMQVRQTFMSRTDQEKEDWMQYLDALEGLRTQ